MSVQQRGLNKRAQAYEAHQHGRRLHVPATGRRQIPHQGRVRKMPKDGVRAGILSLAQLMKGGFDAGVGLHRTMGAAMGSRWLPAPGQWRGKLLNCVGSPMETDEGE